MKNYKASQGTSRIRLDYARDNGLHFHVVELADRSEFGEEAVLRSLEKLQQACQPAYASLFVPISNQPGGEYIDGNCQAGSDAATKLRRY